MQIVFLDGLSLGKNNLKELLSPLGAYTEYENTKPHETLQRCKGAEIVLSNKVVLDRNILKELQGTLKLICITATGTNNVDLEAAREFNIEVKNVAGYSTKSVAQHALMMALNLSAKVSYYDDFCKSGEYAKSGLFTNLSEPLELMEGKRWGIIGLGSIGKEVAKLASAFGVEIVYYSTSGKNDNKDYKSISLEELLKTSRIVSIHAPLNENTKNLLNASNLPLMQEGSILINVGRGGIVNEEDLSSLMLKHKIYAGFDVFSKEPMEANHPFLNPKLSQQFLLTPHNAWGYENSKEILINGVVKNVKDFLRLS
ncbi:hydroxyacid dehydrogenase [Helicobacter valdiviensis]|uniref:Hydroxyacid dehydrogenase n=1 Tax=Helicobacter valdiviensis TaxID=1458358 RepID=A0A2W6PN26_9HELI|nr:D-2-hydroxyacid dehydrogenase [Helicobacter valdiviensis]PZT48103.1 hydroxyacid dehydrogenase [Helicobacter valdiviensis]